MDYFKEGEVFDVSNVQTYGDVSYVGDQPVNSIIVTNTNPWYYTPIKSAREQVQDEILTKMAEAIERDDLKKAKELVKLAKALKEL